MTIDIDREVAHLQSLSGHELRQRYEQVYGESTTRANKTWLIRRIAWRLQALAQGDLSQRARQRAAELANDADLRWLPPRAGQAPTRSQPRTISAALPPPAAAPVRTDERLPAPGSIITRHYKGTIHHVTVHEHGFEYSGRMFTSLSAVAETITGSHCSGFFFFRLDKKGTHS